MFRSSTSSSDPPLRWRRVVLIALMVVLAAEGFFRIPMIEAAIGPPSIYYLPEVQERLDALHAVQAEHGDIDVLFVGSSVARTNLSPLVFDTAMASAGDDVVSFTAGLGGMQLDPGRFYLERLWLEETQPDVVVQVVRYGDLAEADSVDGFYPFDGGKYEQLWLSESPMVPVQGVTLGLSRLVQYAGLLTGVLVRPDSALVLDAVEIDERGFSGSSRRLVEDQRPIGEIPGGDIVEQGHRGPVDSAVFDSGLDVLAETNALVRQHGAQYVLVVMPEHGDMFLPHPQGMERLEFYVNELRTFALEHDVPFFDLTKTDLDTLQDDSLWANYIYLTSPAAEELTRRLAAAFVADEATRRMLVR